VYETLFNPDDVAAGHLVWFRKTEPAIVTVEFFHAGATDAAPLVPLAE
jgi:hypothetical protein